MPTPNDDPFPIDGLLTVEELEFLASDPVLRRMCDMRPGQRVLGIKARGKGWRKPYNYCVKSAYKADNAGEFKRALGAMTLALRLLPRQLDLDATRARLLSNSTAALHALGEYDVARERVEQALDLHQRCHLANNPALDADRAGLLTNSAVTLHALGEYDAARERNEQALDLHQRRHLANNPALDADWAHLLTNSAVTLHALGEYDAARELEKQAWDLLQRRHLRNDPALDANRARLLTTQALTLGALGEYDAARELEKQAWDLLQRRHLRNDPALDASRVYLLNTSAINRHACGQPEEGLAHLRRAIQQLLDTPAKITGVWVKATVQVAWLLFEETATGGCTDGPKLLAPLSVAFIEVIDLQPESFLAFARPSFIQFHRIYLDLCLRQGPHDLLPEVLRAVQGRKMAALMLEELDQTPTSDRTVNEFRDLRRKLRQMALGLQALSGGLDGPGGMQSPRGGDFTRLLPSQHAISADEVTRRVREYEALLPTYRQLRSELEHTGRLPDPKRGKPLAELQKTLKPGQALALLVHLPIDTDAEPCAPAITAALLVTATTTELVHLKNLPQVAYESQRYSDACRGRGRRQTLTRSAPTDASAPADGNAAPSLDDLRRQINQSFWEPLRPHLDGITQLTLLPHGDLLHALPYELAAPDNLQLRFYPGLVFYDQACTAEGPALRHPGPDAPLGLRVHPAEETDNPLYFVPAEAELVRQIWEQTGAAVINPADLTQAPPAWSVFHAASHGNLDPDQPGSAHLLLGPQEHLNLRGVLAARQRPPLVFLSACVVGRLQEDPDGDPLGLVSGFFLKGTRYVIAPLIPVPDDYMALLAVLFHQAWQTGLDPIAALAEAKRRLRQADWYADTAALVQAAYAAPLELKYQHAGMEGDGLYTRVRQRLDELCDPRTVADEIEENGFLDFVRGFGDPGLGLDTGSTPMND